LAYCNEAYNFFKSLPPTDRHISDFGNSTKYLGTEINNHKNVLSVDQGTTNKEKHLQHIFKFLSAF